MKSNIHKARRGINKTDASNSSSIKTKRGANKSKTGSRSRPDNLPPDVEIEIRAVQLADGERATDSEYIGMSIHARRVDLPSSRSSLRGQLEAGWLCRELRTHDYREYRDRNAWTWDTARPIAGQYAEFIARLDRVDAAPRREQQSRPSSRASSLARSEYDSDQKRYHVAAAVARHADFEKIPAAEAWSPPRFVGVGTIDIDSDESGTATQINGLDTALPMFTPNAADLLADDLLAGADAARQAEQDGYAGPAAVLGLEIGNEPEQGVELEVNALPDKSWSTFVYNHDEVEFLQTSQDGYDGPTAVLELVVGDEPEQGVEFEVIQLPDDNHERPDYLSGRPVDEVGPCTMVDGRLNDDSDSATDSDGDEGVSNADADISDNDGNIWDAHTSISNDESISDADAGVSDNDGCISDAALAAIAYAPFREPKERLACIDNAPRWFTGRWTDWHRGHGCNKDDGKPRTTEGAAEIEDAHGASNAAGSDT